MEARANGTELKYKDKLNIIAMEEDIIAKRNPNSHETSFMQTLGGSCLAKEFCSKKCLELTVLYEQKVQAKRSVE